MSTAASQSRRPPLRARSHDERFALDRCSDRAAFAGRCARAVARTAFTPRGGGGVDLRDARSGRDRAQALGVAAEGAVSAYLLGNWRAPFGIALALDRLSALMLALTALVAVAACSMRAAAARADGMTSADRTSTRCSSSS